MIFWTGESIEWYRRAAATHNYHQLLAEKVLSYIPNQDRARIFDLGAGLGYLSLAMAPHAKEVTALDVSLEAIDWLNNEVLRRKVNNVLTVNGDFTKLEPPPAMYDAAVLCFFGRLAQVLPRLRQWVKGPIIFITSDSRQKNFGVANRKKNHSAEDSAMYLRGENIAYKEERLTLSFGQPFLNREDAGYFLRFYNRDLLSPVCGGNPHGDTALPVLLPADLEKAIDSHLNKNLLDSPPKVAAAGYPLYLPCVKSLRLLVIEGSRTSS